MADRLPLGPREGVVVHMLVLPLGYEVVGVGAGGPTIAWEDGWIDAKSVGHLGGIPRGSARYHLERQVQLGHAEEVVSPSGVPLFRWRAVVDPTLYDRVEPVVAST